MSHNVISIYVGNLPYDAKESELAELFGRHGEVIRATIILDRVTHRPRGFAFVEMTNRAEAEAALEALTAEPFRDRPLTINIARNQSSRSSGNTSLSVRTPRKATDSRDDSDNTPIDKPSSASKGYSNSFRTPPPPSEN